MRKRSIINLGLIILFAGLLFLVGCSDSEDATKNVEPDTKNEDVIENEENDLDEETESSESERIINSLFTDYEKNGKECKEIQDTIERGDCFQTVNSKQLNWYMNEDKAWFYFPFQRQQDHWEDVVYFEVDDNGEIGELQQAEGYDNFLNKGNSEAFIEHGKEVMEGYWYVFSNLIPKENRAFLGVITWTDTGEDSVFAVGRNRDNVEKMRLLFSNNLSKYESSRRYMLLHEYAHMLTLNDSQGKVDAEVYLSEDESVWEQAEAECPNYFGWACMEESSYMNQFYLTFWEDIMSDYEAIDWESEYDYRNFFFKYEDRFFNSYQGTTPREDIADSFAFFVLLNSNELIDNTEMKYEKVEFFYQYDELVELRTAILENLYDLVIRDEMFY